MAALQEALAARSREMVRNTEGGDEYDDITDYRPAPTPVPAPVVAAAPEPPPERQPAPTRDAPRPRPAKPAVSTEPLHKVVTRRSRALTTEQSKIDISMPTAVHARLLAYEDAVLARLGVPVVRASLVQIALERLPDSLKRLERWLPTEEEMAGPRAGAMDTRVHGDLKRALRQKHGVWRRDRPGLSMNDIAVAALSSLLDALEADLAAEIAAG